MSLFEAGIQASLEYLASEGASRSLAANAYWPKWDSPWWHITLLHEMGEAKRIPRSARQAMVKRLGESPPVCFMPAERSKSVPKPGTSFPLRINSQQRGGSV